jgi:hypothetical protein
MMNIGEVWNKFKIKLKFKFLYFIRKILLERILFKDKVYLDV